MTSPPISSPICINDISFGLPCRDEDIVQKSASSDVVCLSNLHQASAPPLFTNEASRFSPIPISSGSVYPIGTQIWTPQLQTIQKHHPPFQTPFAFVGNFESTIPPTLTLAAQDNIFNYSGGFAPMNNYSYPASPLGMGNLPVQSISPDLLPTENAQIHGLKVFSTTVQAKFSPVSSDSEPGLSGSTLSPPSPTVVCDPTGDKRSCHLGIQQKLSMLQAFSLKS